MQDPIISNNKQYNKHFFTQAVGGVAAADIRKEEHTHTLHSGLSLSPSITSLAKHFVFSMTKCNTLLL